MADPWQGSIFDLPPEPASSLVRGVAGPLRSNARPPGAPDAPPEALALRDEALARLKASNKRLVDACRAAMIRLYVERLHSAAWAGRDDGVFVTGDDATRWLDDRPDFQGDNRLVGAVFRPRSGWVKVGTVPSLLKKRHGRLISAWRWKGASDGGARA